VATEGNAHSAAKRSASALLVHSPTRGRRVWRSVRIKLGAHWMNELSPSAAQRRFAPSPRTTSRRRRGWRRKPTTPGDVVERRSWTPSCASWGLGSGARSQPGASGPTGRRGFGVESYGPARVADAVRPAAARAVARPRQDGRPAITGSSVAGGPHFIRLGLADDCSPGSWTAKRASLRWRW